MPRSPRLLGAVAAVLVTGIGSGAIIGKVPPMRQIGLEDMIPEARHVASAFPQEQAAQDQYPVETPEGRFEIEELSERGLYRNARFAVYHAYDEPAYIELEAAYSAVPDAPPVEMPATVATAAGGDPIVAESATEPPLDGSEARSAAAAAPALAAAGPRIVDVTAELAARRRAE